MCFWIDFKPWLETGQQSDQRHSPFCFALAVTCLVVYSYNSGLFFFAEDKVHCGWKLVVSAVNKNN